MRRGKRYRPDRKGGAMPDEVELKVALRPHDAVALADSGLLGGDPQKARQKSLYFDTADHSLFKAGLSLRIRRAGRKRTQTVKARGGGSAGLFARPEWERVVGDDTPVVDHTTPIRALLGERADGLAPLFEVRVERSTWSIREGDAVIELVLDRGAVVAGDRRSPICEIELELKSGDASALFAFARKLDSVAPVRLGVLTKAERGYALLDPLVSAFRAGRVDLHRDMTAVQAFQHIVQACLREFRLNEDLFLIGQAPEALHQARVALRRLRSALSIFDALIADDASAGLRDTLRWLAAGLGQARSIDVLVERAPPGALRDRLEAARQTAYVHVEDILGSSRARGLMFDLAQWSMSGEWLRAAGAAELRDQPARAFASAALDRLRRKVKRGGRDLAAGDQARHELRKNAKKLRYGAEFFAALFERKPERRRYKRFISALQALQESLGTLNDLVTAPVILARLEIGDPPDAVALLFPDNRKKLLNVSDEAHAALVDGKRFWRCG